MQNVNSSSDRIAATCDGRSCDKELVGTCELVEDGAYMEEEGALSEKKEGKSC